MSRAGYSDDLDNWALIRWRGQVASATRGKRGQQFLRDLLTALDTLPEKRLIRNELQDNKGEVCALGALGKSRNMDMGTIDPGEPEDVASAFNIAEQLAREVVYVNDEWGYNETPEQRYKRMREWVSAQIREAANAPR
jgi:hypothetical protein